jgi:hypothetical protein
MKFQKIFKKIFKNYFFSLYCNKNLIILIIKKNKKSVQTILKGPVKVLANKGYKAAIIIGIAEASGLSREGSCTIILKTKRIMSQKPYLVVLLKWCNHILHD